MRESSDPGGKVTVCDICGGPVEVREVTYRLEFDDRLIVVEHVPARVCLQYGETTYSPETVERLQRTVGMGRSRLEYQMRLT